MKKLLILIFICLSSIAIGQSKFAISNNKFSVSNNRFAKITLLVDNNMISNGTFDSSTGWVLTGTAVIEDGVAKVEHEREVGQTDANMVSSFVSGDSYRLTFTSNNSGYVYLQTVSGNVGLLSSDQQQIVSGSNQFEFIFSSAAYADGGGFRIRNASGAIRHFDNIVIIKIADLPVE